jgi:hypothetical protein
MADDKSKVGSRVPGGVVLKQPYEVEEFHQKHRHLTREEALQIIKDTKGIRAEADEIAEQLRLNLLHLLRRLSPPG